MIHHPQQQGPTAFDHVSQWLKTSNWTQENLRGASDGSFRNVCPFVQIIWCGEENGNAKNLEHHCLHELPPTSQAC